MAAALMEPLRVMFTGCCDCKRHSTRQTLKMAVAYA
jgi:hypothetical protein